jgi:hypothetical protein
MTDHRRVRLAVGALLQAALPSATIAGFDGSASVPEIIPEGGLVLALPSEPEEAGVDLSPPAYQWRNAIPVDVTAPGGAAGEMLDAMLGAIGAAVAADPTLGGLCHWTDTTAPTLADRTESGVTINWAEISIVPEYATSRPLG